MGNAATHYDWNQQRLKSYASCEFSVYQVPVLIGAAILSVSRYLLLIMARNCLMLSANNCSLHLLITVVVVDCSCFNKI